MTTGNRSLCRVVLPIRLGIDLMERLLVASFKGDPEFEGFEPQVFDDPINGKGMRVLRYRKDGKVDVYWQPGVRVDKSTFTLGAGRVFCRTRAHQWRSPALRSRTCSESQSIEVYV